MYTAPVPAYVTLKDHKPNFNNNPSCRLINPSKIEIGKISKQILSRVVNDIKEKTQLKLWKNTDSVINWFDNLENKESLSFIQFDICDYYGSVTKKLFQDAVNWVKQYSNISEKEENAIFQSKISLLSDGETTWKKKGDDDFHIAMGSWDSAESTDLVGLFLLCKMKDLNVNVGLYRDDGLLCSRTRPRQLEKLKKILVVNFLDITLEFNTGQYTPFMKENNTIRYIQ